MTKITKAAQDAIAEFDRYFTSANGVDVPERVTVSRDEWRALRAALQDKAGEPVGFAMDEQFAHAIGEGAHVGASVVIYKERQPRFANTPIYTSQLAAQPAPVVPDGFALVPVGPDEEWIYRVIRQIQPDGHVDSNAWFREQETMMLFHAAMIAASRQK